MKSFQCILRRMLCLNKILKGKLFKSMHTVFSHKPCCSDQTVLEGITMLLLDWGLPCAGLFFTTTFWIMGTINTFPGVGMLMKL